MSAAPASSTRFKLSDYLGADYPVPAEAPPGYACKLGCYHADSGCRNQKKCHHAYLQAWPPVSQRRAVVKYNTDDLKLQEQALDAAATGEDIYKWRHRKTRKHNVRTWCDLGRHDALKFLARTVKSHCDSSPAPAAKQWREDKPKRERREQLLRDCLNA